MKVGYFGKLPSYGDFIQRNVTPDLVKHWDNWILQAIEVSRSQLRENWQQRYFNSPIWRFVINKGLISDSLIAGFMMPSVDKSGRCYPFTVICETDVDVNPFILARKIDALHAKAEDFVIGLLEKSNPNLDDIQRVLTDLYSGAKDAHYIGANLTSVASCMEIGSIKDQHVSDLAACNETFLQSLLVMQKVKITLWWTSGGIGLTPRKRYFSGMPPVDSYNSFLLGVDN